MIHTPNDAPTPRWPVVVFDLDGTLADSINVIVASYRHCFKEVTGRQVTREEVLPWIGRTLTQVFLAEAPDRAAELENAYLKYNAAWLPEMLTGFPGVSALLIDLHAAGVQTGIATAKRRAVALRSMEIAELPVGVIDLTVAMEDTLVHKPDPTPLLLALDKLGRRPDESVYVGDAIWDLQAADRAGMAGIGVTWGAGRSEDLRAEPSMAVVDTVDQLRALLLG